MSSLALTPLAAFLNSPELPADIWLHPGKTFKTARQRSSLPVQSGIVRISSRIPGIQPMIGTLRSTRGNAVIEFAFVFPVLFGLFIGIMEFSRVFYIRLTLLSAVREASRFTVTGN